MESIIKLRGTNKKDQLKSEAERSFNNNDVIPISHIASSTKDNKKHVVNSLE